MKVAVLCCGQLRSFLKCKDSIEKHILTQNNCSLFVYTDTEIASSTTLQWNGSVYSLPKSGINDLYEKSISEIKKLVQKYNCNLDILTKESDYLDRIKIEPHFKVEKPDWWDNSIGSFDGTYFNSFNKQQVFNLFQNYIKKYNLNFDYVLYIRPDMFFFEDINIEKELSKIPEIKIENKINNERYIVMYSPITEFKYPDVTIKSSSLSRNVACDTVCWATVDTFAKFMSDVVDNVVNSLKDMQGTVPCCYESAFWLALYKKNISRYVLYKDYSILRLVRTKIRFSDLIRIRIKKTSTRIFVFRIFKIRTIMFAIVLFGYPIYIQFFSDKYIQLLNYYEKEKR